MLPRFIKEMGDRKNFKGDPLSAWVYLLTRGDFEEVALSPELTADDEAVRSGYKRLSGLSYDEEDALMRNMYDKASNLLAKAITKGMADGMAKYYFTVLRTMKAHGMSKEKAWPIFSGTNLDQETFEDFWNCK